jgi:hypothetical protein
MPIQARGDANAYSPVIAFDVPRSAEEIHAWRGCDDKMPARP